MRCNFRTTAIKIKWYGCFDVFLTMARIKFESPLKNSDGIDHLIASDSLAKNITNCSNNFNYNMTRNSNFLQPFLFLHSLFLSKIGVKFKNLKILKLKRR